MVALTASCSLTFLPGSYGVPVPASSLKEDDTAKRNAFNYTASSLSGDDTGTVGTAILCPADKAVFRDTSIGAIVSWLWNFGNGSTSTAQNPPPFSYAAAGTTTYPVQLIVADTANCKDTAFMQVKSVTNCYIRVPSSFTPNHDGLNDDLYPLNAYKATHLLFTVYNRFGQRVFSTTDWTRKWDGTYNSIEQPAGTYVWTLTYTDPDHQQVSLVGSSVLLR